MTKINSPCQFWQGELLFHKVCKEDMMPVLSMFYGIIIRMQSEHGGKHHVPHIHVICGDDESVFSLDGELIEGTIPIPKRKLVEAWIEIHKEDLQANWKLLDEGEQYFKIDPLK